MNDKERIAYHDYLKKLNDIELLKESSTVVWQRNSILIQYCYNEWKDRNKQSRFLEVYNQAIMPMEKDFH